MRRLPAPAADGRELHLLPCPKVQLTGMPTRRIVP